MGTQELIYPAMRRVKNGDRSSVQFEFRSAEDADRFWQYAARYERRKGIVNTTDGHYGGYYRVVLRTPMKKRSTGKNSQNTHLHDHIQQICEETGNDFADVKLYIKKQALAMGYPPMRDEAGEIVFSMMDHEPIPQSEAEASTTEAAILIEAAHMLAAEMEILLKEAE